MSVKYWAFTETAVRAMAKHNERPIIFPLSNPISCAEAKPADVERWSEGRALIGCGSPFPPITRGGVPFRVAQTNNSYIFPGVGLGAIAAQARRISDAMFMAAARALAALSPSRRDPKANLLPPVTALHDVAVAVAVAVGKQAQADGLAAYRGDVEQAARGKMWTPKYLPYRRAG